MLADILIIMGLIALAATVPRVVDRHRRRARLRAVKRSKPFAIAAIPETELARITGTIAPRGELLKSPIGLEPCIGYSAVIETAIFQSAVGYTTWDMVMNSMKCGSFYITDETGTALVEGPVFIVRSPGAAWETPPESAWPTLDGQQVRCQEMLLRPGDRVSVLGRSTMELDPAGRGSYREPPMLPHLRGSDRDPVIVANADELQVF